jgi:hypothetical protein
MTVRFNRAYFALTVFLFVVEVLIALFVRDGFVRPYLGDVLVVILMYACIKAFFNFSTIVVTAGVLLFAFAIEFLQYLQIVNKLGLQKSKLISTIVGTSFAWNDIVAYIAGACIILIVEQLVKSRQ